MVSPVGVWLFDTYPGEHNIGLIIVLVSFDGNDSEEMKDKLMRTSSALLMSMLKLDVA